MKELQFIKEIRINRDVEEFEEWFFAMEITSVFGEIIFRGVGVQGGVDTSGSDGCGCSIKKSYK